VRTLASGRREGLQPEGPERRLKELGFELPASSPPSGSYVEAVQTGNLLFLSGILPVVNPKPKYLGPYFPHISNGISGEFPGRVLSLSGASAPVVNLHVHISFSLAFPDNP
jgi:hypothetical protein